MTTDTPAASRLPFLASRTAAVVLACFTFVAVICVLRHGMPMSPDGWVYWQGSLGMLEGRGYVDLGGDPIRFWPPGYSAYLALCQACLGVSGMALVVSTALAAALATGGWAWFARRYAALRGASPGSANLAALFCALLIVLYSRDLRSETIMRVFMPLSLGIALDLRGRATSIVRSLGLLVLCVSAMTVFRNVALALVPAIAFAVVGYDARRPFAERVWIACVLISVPTAVWIAVQAIFGQLGATEVGFGTARYSPLEYGLQLMRSLGKVSSVEGLGQVLLGIAAITVVRRDRALSMAHGRCLLVAIGIALAATYMMFNLSNVADKLAGRFVLFVSLTFGCLSIVDAPRQWRGWALMLFIVAMLSYPLIKVSKHVIIGKRSHAPTFTESPHEQWVPWNGTLDTDHRSGPAIERDGSLILPPPAFPWLPASGPHQKR